MKTFQRITFLVLAAVGGMFLYHVTRPVQPPSSPATPAESSLLPSEPTTSEPQPATSVVTEGQVLVCFDGISIEEWPVRYEAVRQQAVEEQNALESGWELALLVRSGLDVCLVGHGGNSTAASAFRYSCRLLTGTTGKLYDKALPSANTVIDVTRITMAK